MKKSSLQESIKNVEESLKMSRDNRDKAEYHIEEGEIILAALQAKMETFK